MWRPSWWRHAWYRMRSAHLPGAAAFVLRPGSPLAVAYLGALEAKLEEHADSLRRGAALSADGTPTLGYETYRSLPGYPFSWTALGADVLHPVGLRFRDRVDLSLPPPVVTDYR